ncbi:L-serine ammonia-lyase [Granulosicoccus antarcticus]|uniref:L-serine dehydratase n=1 Tax=Granulosicoccus antarcticus IMCC3135 TaxID=1192854 RepID=A0A2Z2NY19_9GAMM|nr:L-serine ammonia-lyase [Granulosicoccus antarcticus]ASJ76183.1 L-serine dehydratase 2 [Granulosicoccus antarcticus IMCC3135]
MFLSVFDIFKIGIGPSSSHTMGPMTGAVRFMDALRELVNASVEDPNLVPLKPARIEVTLHGSLAFTGKGHATDRAVILGLTGLLPDTLDPDDAERLENEVRQSRRISVDGMDDLDFDPATDLVFDYGPALPGHANGLVFKALDAGGALVMTETFYSIGGGFVVTHAELSDSLKGGSPDLQAVKEEQGYPYPFGSAKEMLRMGKESGLRIAEMKRANEIAHSGSEKLSERLDTLCQAMNGCIDRGLQMEGVLPGGLGVKRRARAIHQQLLAERGKNMVQPHAETDWLAVYAMAVNEENAAGGRVVTSPTNGAAGVVPAVMRYYRDHCVGANDEGVIVCLLTAAAIGGLIKHNASISGAEVGCQGEVGSASAMAAAGLCAALGGSNEQIENAAEIALEHHLGMTCDPAGGLVQVPCIERNALGAVKAVSAASLALRGDGSHFMPLDNCIETMRQTGLDMNHKYKETSLGGIAVNFPAC